MKDIVKPTLVLDTKKMFANLTNMQAKANSNNLIFRPHFKTHQSTGIAEYYRQRGIDRITVSSLDMARYFVEEGWRDITVAFPTNLLQRDLIAELHSKAQINLISDDCKVIEALDNLKLEGLGILIEVDAGYHRTGVDINNHQKLEELVGITSTTSFIDWKGFLVHNGHSYQCRTKEEIVGNHQQSMKLLKGLAPFREKYSGCIVSLGDTPSFSIMDQFEGFDEMRPGNFVFYDLAQWQIGSCDLSDIAVCMACPVVAKYPERGELVVYGGGVHFSKDRINWCDRDIYGFPVGLTESGWSMPDLEGYVSSLSQEHGIIKLPADQLDIYQIGDLIGVLPIHSCLTADAMGGYRSLDGEIFDHF